MKYCNDPADFVAKGFRVREYFHHEVIGFPKHYPDTLIKIKENGFPVDQVLRGQFFQLNMYSTDVDGFPEELFTDQTVNWHGQQYGKKGLIGVAGLSVFNNSIYIDVLESDITQYIFRSEVLKKTCRNQWDRRFQYWYLMLLNAVLDFALDRGYSNVYSLTGDHVVAMTWKSVSPDLFRKIYDSVESRYTCKKKNIYKAEFWEIPIKENRDRIVQLKNSKLEPPRLPKKIIYLFHDVEEDVDTKVSKDECKRALTQMLAIEKQKGVQVTYNVTGLLYEEKLPEILRSDNHSLAFHSYNHKVEDLTQLGQVRGVNLQVKGYRPAQSIITTELTDYNLSYSNFEWLMSGGIGLGTWEPILENGIVKIPAHMDDYPLYTGEQSYENWSRELLSGMEEYNFVGIGLHDCYSRCWLEFYSELIDQLREKGEIWTCNQIINYVYFKNAF